MFLAGKIIRLPRLEDNLTFQFEIGSVSLYFWPHHTIPRSIGLT